MNPDELKARKNRLLMGCLESAKVWLNEAIEELKKSIEGSREATTPTTVQPEDKYLVIHIRAEAMYGFDKYSHMTPEARILKVRDHLEGEGWIEEYYEILQLGYDDISIIPRSALNAEPMKDHLLEIVHAAPDDEWEDGNVVVRGYLAKDLFGTTLDSGTVLMCGEFVQDDIDEALRGFTGDKSW